MRPDLGRGVDEGKYKGGTLLQERASGRFVALLFAGWLTMKEGSKAVSLLVVATLLSSLLLTLNLLLLTFGAEVSPLPQGPSTTAGDRILEVKIVLVDNSLFPTLSGAIEAVGQFLINGGVDCRSRQYKFRTGETVTLQAMEEMYGYKFASWQKRSPDSQAC